MNHLKIIANNIVPVYETSKGKQIVNARELHKSLMVGKDFTSWIKDRIEKYDFVEGKDFELTLTKIGERSNVTRHDYWLTISMAKEVAMVQNNEIGKVTRKYFIEVENRSKQVAMPQTQAEMLLMYAQQMVEAEKRVSQLEHKQSQTENEVKGIREVVALNSREWRKDTTSILNKIAVKQGGYERFREVRTESYELLEKRAGAKLQTRLMNKRKKMALEGVAKSKINNVSKVDVIDEDKRLLEIYLAIVKEMAIRYSIDTSDLKEVN